VKALAAFLGCAVLAASIWLGWLSRRPVELTWYVESFDQARVCGVAIAVGILTTAVTWIAARPGARWTSPVSISAAGALVVLAAARRPQLPTAVVVVTDAAWLGGAAAVAAMVLATPRFANVPRRPAAALLALVAGSGIAAAMAGGGTGLGATIGPSPSAEVASSTRVLLAVHLFLLDSLIAYIALLAHWADRAAVAAAPAVEAAPSPARQVRRRWWNRERVPAPAALPDLASLG